MDPHLFGIHPSSHGGIEMTVRRAAAAGAGAMQVFTTIPYYYGDRSGISKGRLKRFRDAVAATGFDAANVVVHAAYVLNTASPEPEKARRAAAGLAKELERSSALGAGGVCFHPGSAMDDGDIDAALDRVAAAITGALRAVDSDTRIWVENTAGAGATVGRTPEEVGGILSRVPEPLRARAGYGLDTCHLYAAGHDIAASPETLGQVLDAFEAAAGEPPSFFHLNDSEGELGSNRDRHMLLGEGRIGEAPFGWLLADARSRGVPLVLETPHEWKDDDLAEDDETPDPYDVRMLETLRRLAG
ncbi:MAG: deoxyribonuclease IV [Gemmatimonadota bacterium]